MSEQRTMRIGSVSTVFGAVALLCGTLLDPVNMAPKDSVFAFTEHAASDRWLVSHLCQLVGLLFVVGGMVALYGLIARRSSRSVARLGLAGAIASAGVFAALQAVDGIALRRMVVAWAGAPAAEKPAVFHAAEAVRQIEVGLASAFALLFGITVVLYGASIVMSTVFPKWLGWVAVVAGLGTVADGVVKAHTGFSPLALEVGMPSILLVIAWLLAIGSLMWRRSGLA